jgi:phenylpropionate dioxygenase-like ring-hydroxylating dioxygenase large terminal subunit
MNMQASFTVKGGMSYAPMRSDTYCSASHFELERTKVFSRCWLVIGREDEIPNPKDYMVRDVEICRARILVTRQRDGSIRCFHNVCSHRNNQVVLDRKGSASSFACSYHKWTYSLDGQLRGVPDEASFPGLDKSKCSLKQVHSDMWNGFIFVNFESTPSVSLREFLGDFGTLLDGIHLPFATTPVVIEAIVHCNWKAVMDGFSESYHVAAIHPKTIAPSFYSKVNPYGRPIDMQFSGPHHRAVIAGNPEYVPSKADRVEALSLSHISGNMLTTTGNVQSGKNAAEVAKMMSHKSANMSKVDAWVNDLNMIFPNFHIDLSPGGFWTHQFWPLEPGKTRWEARWYIPKAATVRDRFQQEHFIAKLAEIMLEDLGNTERQQLGVESGAQPHIQLGDVEALIRHNLVHIDKWIQADRVTEALKQ